MDTNTIFLLRSSWLRWGMAAASFPGAAGRLPHVVDQLHELGHVGLVLQAVDELHDGLGAGAVAVGAVGQVAELVHHVLIGDGVAPVALGVVHGGGVLGAVLHGDGHSAGVVGGIAALELVVHYHGGAGDQALDKLVVDIVLVQLVHGELAVLEGDGRLVGHAELEIHNVPGRPLAGLGQQVHGVLGGADLDLLNVLGLGVVLGHDLQAGVQMAAGVTAAGVDLDAGLGEGPVLAQALGDILGVIVVLEGVGVEQAVLALKDVGGAVEALGGHAGGDDGIHGGVAGLEALGEGALGVPCHQAGHHAARDALGVDGLLHVQAQELGGGDAGGHHAAGAGGVEALIVHIAQVGGAHAAHDLIAHGHGGDVVLAALLQALAQGHAHGEGGGGGVGVGLVVVVHEIQAIALDGVGKGGVGGGYLVFGAYDGGLGGSGQLLGDLTGDLAGDHVPGAHHGGQHVQGEHLGLGDGLGGELVVGGGHCDFGNLGCNRLVHGNLPPEIFYWMRDLRTYTCPSMMVLAVRRMAAVLRL